MDSTITPETLLCLGTTVLVLLERVFLDFTPGGFAFGLRSTHQYIQGHTRAPHEVLLFTLLTFFYATMPLKDDEENEEPPEVVTLLPTPPTPASPPATAATVQVAAATVTTAASLPPTTQGGGDQLLTEVTPTDDGESKGNAVVHFELDVRSASAGTLITMYHFIYVRMRVHGGRGRGRGHERV
jgi:hypothetical protein